MLDTTVTLYGNVAKSPDLGTTPNGSYRANLRIASSERRWDRASGRYVDGETIFINVTCWSTLGENVAASVRKGDPVVVIGKLRQRTYVNADKEVVHTVEVAADLLAFDLRRGTVAGFRRTARPSSAEDGTGTTEQRPGGVTVPSDGGPEGGLSDEDLARLESALAADPDDELVGATAGSPAGGSATPETGPPGP